MASVQVSNGEAAPSSFKSRKKSATVFRAFPEVGDIINLFHGSDPVRFELNRLENEIRDKDRELGDARTEIKALKYSESLKERAVEELNDELNKVNERIKTTEALLESKNLEIKKINDEKKETLAAQFAAEATLRRVHAAQKDDAMPPIEAIITPLEAELKLARMEVSKLQDDNRALDRLTKSKEAALLEAERTVQMAMAKASLVDDLQNKNQELMKQIEICQEESRILDKMQRQKVVEVEKLTQTVRELEEAVLAGGAAANAVRDYQRKVQEMNEEKKILDRELSRAKVSANRVAVVVANEWKDDNDKVMPVKQWLEERRLFQGEMQQLRDKLAIAERTAKAEAQLKEKYQLRFKVLEERLKASRNGVSRAAQEGKTISSGHSRRQSLGGAENLSISSTNGLLSRNLQSGPLRSNSEEGNAIEKAKTEYEDYVSGMLYDMIQKEVLTLRKASTEKDQTLKDKDDAIEMLAKKVETLNRAMEVEGKRMRREVSVMEKEVAAMRIGKERDQRSWRPNAPREAVNGHQSLSARNARNS